MRYASVGIGSNNHYDTEAFAKWAGIQLVHIPNKGGGAAITNDLVTGDAQVAFVNAASSAGVMRAGQLRPLAVMSDRRVPEYDVPTTVELGYANGKGLWSALYAPSATPRDVLDDHSQSRSSRRLNSEPVQTAFKRQMIKAVPNASIEDAKAWNCGRDRALEEGHRRPEGRAAGQLIVANLVRTAFGSCRSSPRKRGPRKPLPTGRNVQVWIPAFAGISGGGGMQGKTQS